MCICLRPQQASNSLTRTRFLRPPLGHPFISPGLTTASHRGCESLRWGPLVRPRKECRPTICLAAVAAYILHRVEFP